MRINHQRDDDKRVEKNFTGLEVTDTIDSCCSFFGLLIFQQ